VEFASERDGVMHACGHDGHTAMLLGAAQELASRAGELHGELRFLFQPAEERPPGGLRPAGGQEQEGQGIAAAGQGHGDGLGAVAQQAAVENLSDRLRKVGLIACRRGA